ncbi:multisubunit sodium/proton antiporter, MrpF subunit (TC 2.A.63.1) [Microbulbifer donghaiensis]|uniref:Multisubunit sodium/proton antiporter, MrpF subunit (TC 2.A.63.1) n=1 Tax=Microbulbifer donghaiensis TaxID=494016 RepID=A0A1M4UHP7_9GAMM|nr:monovalent cation/H+ antiporter complex subunit F [Microbulbifer donghaiensis]SHE56227.1 multisubunit sodium/proton antiporter, MrpF subunit (TC 2.A.63.1) [Microbulbifer donghaiensis]
MLAATIIALLVVMAMALIRALLGPSVYDRILAVNVFGTKTVLLIAVICFTFGKPEFLDIALVYALINFVSVIGVLRYFEFRSGSGGEVMDD